MSDRESISGPITLPPLLQACVDDGLLDRDVAETVDSFRRSSGVGMIRALGKLGLLSEGGVPGVSDRDGAQEAYRPLLVSSAVDPEQTFDTFVVCQANAFPVEVARRVAEGRASRTYNPLYLYSDVGLGKTHLLCAIGNAAESARVVNTVDLEVEYERARRLELRAEFRRFLAEPEILAVDDIQLCEGDEDLQRELFSVLNHRIREGKSVVITSDVPPTRLGGVEERLVSRLGGGVILGLQMCEAPELVEILRRSFGDEALPPQVIDYPGVEREQEHQGGESGSKTTHMP